MLIAALVAVVGQTAILLNDFGPGNDSLVTFRRKIDVSGIEVNGLPQNKTRRGVRRA